MTTPAFHNDPPVSLFLLQILLCANNWKRGKGEGGRGKGEGRRGKGREIKLFSAQFKGHHPI